MQLSPDYAYIQFLTQSVFVKPGYISNWLSTVVNALILIDEAALHPAWYIGKPFQ